MNPLILCAVLLAAGSLLLLGAAWRRQASQRQVAQRVDAGGRNARGRLAEIGEGPLLRRFAALDGETRQLLDVLGWRRARQRALFSFLQLAVPLALVALCVLPQLLLRDEPGQLWLSVLFAAGIGYLLPKRILAYKVRQRQERLSEEVSTVLPLLRILFEVGMTVEQALRVLENEAKSIVPELASELGLLLHRVDAGLELGDELDAVARLLDVGDLTDCFNILKQLLHQGGGALASLQSMKALLDDRRMTTIQERVSKMSAKMSLVMMLFLFPALLMVLAGPGFIAIVRALGNMG